MKFKKAICIFLAVLMVLCILPAFSVQAASSASGTCGNSGKVKWSLSNGKLTISGTGAMTDFEYGESTGYLPNTPWYSYREEIRSIVIKSGVTSIGNYAFQSMGEFEIPISLSIADTVKRIGDSAFSMCNLDSIVIPDSVTELGEAAFLMSQKATTVKLSKNLKVIPNGAFQMCPAINNVVIPEGVTTIESGAFTYCNALKTITFPSTLRKINSYAFNYSDCMTKLDTVYYRGTSDGWYEKVSVGEGNDGLSELKAFICNPFMDVAFTSNYFNAVMWAYENGIVAGTSATAFSPNDYCTRGQFALMLWRLAGKQSVSGITNPFTDVSSKSGFYKGIMWAYKNGIVAGTSATTFSPGANIKRFQIVLMLYRMAGSPAVSGSNPFTDIKTSSAYYKAALWAYQNGITGVTTFKPNDYCTRFQLVMFLQRFNKITDYIK